MNETESQDNTSSVASKRSVEIGVALVLMLIAAVVIVDSYRIGAGWDRAVGPQSGYFPFYVALLMFVASAATLVQQIFLYDGHARSFVSAGEFKRVLQVLIPMSFFVVLAIYIGIYVSAFLFIGFFMKWLGRYSIYRTIPVAAAIPIGLFLVFEIWFLVPLPKGPVEHMLGY